MLLYFAIIPWTIAGLLFFAAAGLDIARLRASARRSFNRMYNRYVLGIG